jgi:NitT/TauT family transport system ATP-binding protein
MRVGMVFQEPRLLPWRSVEDNVRLSLPRETRGRSLDALFAQLSLTDWLMRFPGELSGGMQRRVALARALAIEPVLLVLDEPFISLDDHAAADLRRVTFDIVAMRKLSVLMVTHNVREALAFADRLILTSPRPASVLAEVELTEPVRDRTPFWIEAQRVDLATRYPAAVAP